jgi:threonine dehydrogenase-like Zn-dependent dehydrogenase
LLDAPQRVVAEFLDPRAVGRGCAADARANAPGFDVKIAVVGAGAMGSVYAGILGDAGHEVWAVDVWAEHVEAIRRHGLTVEGASGRRIVRIHATSEPDHTRTAITAANPFSGLSS